MTKKNDEMIHEVEATWSNTRGYYLDCPVCGETVDQSRPMDSKHTVYCGTCGARIKPLIKDIEEEVIREVLGDRLGMNVYVLRGCMNTDSGNVEPLEDPDLYRVRFIQSENTAEKNPDLEFKFDEDQFKRLLKIALDMQQPREQDYETTEFFKVINRNGMGESDA